MGQKTLKDQALSFVGFKEGQASSRKWWVNLEHIVAARMQTETVRGHDGRACSDEVVTLYLPCSTPIGEAMCVKVYGGEATALAARLDEVIPELTAETEAA